MFKIFDGRDKFYQWDLDRKLIVEDPEVKERGGLIVLCK